MRVLARAKCSVGGIPGEWSHPDGRCRSYRTCDVCGRAEGKTLHLWGAFDYIPLTDATKVADVNGGTTATWSRTPLKSGSADDATRPDAPGTRFGSESSSLTCVGFFRAGTRVT